MGRIVGVRTYDILGPVILRAEILGPIILGTNVASVGVLVADLLAALLGMLQQIFLELLLRAGARPAESGVPGRLLEIFTGCLAGPVPEMLGPSSNERGSQLSSPSFTKPLLHTGQHPALLFLDVVADRLDQLVKGRRELGRLGVQCRHLLEHVFGLCMFALACATSSISPASLLAMG